MSVFVNFKICDNAQECSGVAVCPTGALIWDDTEKSVVVDNEKCISCGVCVDECPAGAIRVAHNEKEEYQIKEDYENDPRTLKDLLVERYGASPVDETILLSIQELELRLKQENSLMVVEVIDNDDTPCLINSVPISEIFDFEDIEYCKITNGDELYESFAEEYSIKELPSLLVFKNGTILVRVDGGVENGNYIQKTEFINKVRNALRG